ncbi:hypothetical protein RIF23_02490 [Lipingzhangella sp. LS1_29]|uniref:Uncharacterized protein n=1 Tax=Lipingzhangella rawalii TaxID=2055835 RepID=A0ABU2H2R5_9ACTN|nr:hypothetical protein [Lipingzhangella rawalii]MDS1269160.1 hypothetical protein [Lipingzhangella rawalii]
MTTSTDVELLRTYEPILAFTKGELFFPTDVDGYVRCCSLWRDLPGGSEEQLVPAGELTLERLADAEQEWPGQDLHLRFVQEVSLREEARHFHRTVRPVIPRSGRLAAVGVFGRVLDVLMRLSLLIRGAVPGGVAAAAATRYRKHLDSDADTAPYYGRVVREGGYIVCQYWFFYAMNDWRSTFGGVNDHEADWEKVTVYLTQNEDGITTPLWVGASSHEYVGDDLRRSFDDPHLHRSGDHVIVYSGAGSHSHQMQPGDYLIQVDPAFLRGLVRAWRRLAHRILPGSSPTGRHGIGVPFVDYARGDGTHIGPGCDRTWQPTVISEETPWVIGFRGLWGRDTGDWFDGERAPSGPRYERDGTPRRSWVDPLSWVGLHKTPPDETSARQHLTQRLNELDTQIAELDTQIDTSRAELRRQASARTVLRQHPEARSRVNAYTRQLDEQERELADTYRRRALLADERGAHQRALERGDPIVDPPTAHLRAPHVPYASGQHRQTRFLHVWAALSTPLLIIALGALLIYPGPQQLATGTAVSTAIGVVVLFAAFDAWARRKLRSFLAVLAVLGVVSGVLAGLIWAFLWNWQISIMVPIAAAVLVLLVVNVRDLLRG